MEYFAILTLDLPGVKAVTLTAPVMVSGDLTRHRVLLRMKDYAVETYGEEFREGTVVFFSVEPNQLA